MKTEFIDTQKPLLLLVDDNKEILEFIEDDLSEKYTILKALNGVEALAIINQECVQLVISDVMMPELDGFELCQLIKSNVEISHVPVILLAAKTPCNQK